MFILAKQFGKLRNGPVSSNLIMFNALCCPDQSCVHQSAFEVLAHDLAAFLDQTLHAHTFLALWAFIKRLENLLQALHMATCLLEMFFKSLTKLFGGGSLC